MPEPDHVPLTTDAHFKNLGPQAEKCLDFLVELLDGFGGQYPHSALLKRRMLFDYLVLSLDPEGPLGKVLTSPDPQSHTPKALYFLGLYNRAKKEGVDDVYTLSEMVTKDDFSLYTFLYR